MTTGRRILVCDDSSAARRLLSSLLEKRGYVVTAVGSGEEGFTACFENTFDLVVSDVRMGALNGVQLCRLLREDAATAEVPFVLLTAADDPRSRFWGRHAGADAYVVKTEMQQKLLPTVDGILQGRPPRESVAKKRVAADPMRRLSSTLDRMLFDAVLSKDVRRLGTELDRSVLADAVLTIASEVALYSYLLLTITGHEEPTYHLAARGAWPEDPSVGLSKLGLSGFSPDSVVIVPQTPRRPEDSSGGGMRFGESKVLPMRIGDRSVGSLTVWGVSDKISPRDRQTLELIAGELGIVIRSLQLFEETQLLATRDALTGLPNRRALRDHLDAEVTRAERHGRALSVAIVDIDHFKSVNDTFGHGVGDQVLRSVGRALGTTLRRSDMAGRWGGEEFLLLFTETPIEAAAIGAERVRLAIRRSSLVPDGPENISASLGVTGFRPGDNAESMLARADEALYRAKDGGRDRIERG